MKNTLLLVASLICSLFMFCGSANAQEKYPSKPIVFVVGFAAGGSSDIFARFIADYAKRTRGVTVVVENRLGLAGAIAVERIAKSAADGYTVGMGSISSLWVLPQVQQMNYRPLSDFDYLAKMFTQPLPLYVLAGSPFKSYADVLSYARVNPGRFRWGTAGSRGIGEILMALGFQHAKVETVTVPFKAGVDANTALLGGHIEAVASTDFGPLLQAGKVRLLVETGPVKIPGQPDVPTFKELNYPLSVEVFYGIVGPANLPGEVVQWWDALLAEVVKTGEYAELCDKISALSAYENSAGFKQYVTRGYADLGKALAAQPPTQ
jgi:tripartite-type tricarboxylate transporter receptor subunit TctC